MKQDKHILFCRQKDNKHGAQKWQRNIKAQKCSKIPTVVAEDSAYYIQVQKYNMMPLVHAANRWLDMFSYHHKQLFIWQKEQVRMWN